MAERQAREVRQALVVFPEQAATKTCAMEKTMRLATPIASVDRAIASAREARAERQAWEAGPVREAPAGQEEVLPRAVHQASMAQQELEAPAGQSMAEFPPARSSTPLTARAPSTRIASP